MTRKKKQFPQQKRQQVMDSSGWTHIVKGAKNVMTSVKALASNQHQTSFTVDSYANTFQTKYTPQWRESSCWQGLTCMIEREILASENITLTKCVCLGLGSLTVGSHTDTSSYELAALVSMLGLLGMYFAA